MKTLSLLLLSGMMLAMTGCETKPIEPTMKAEIVQHDTVVAQPQLVVSGSPEKPVTHYDIISGIRALGDNRDMWYRIATENAIAYDRQSRIIDSQAALIDSLKWSSVPIRFISEGYMDSISERLFTDTIANPIHHTNQ